MVKMTSIVKFGGDAFPRKTCGDMYPGYVSPFSPA
jgi:hypothetical protein